MCPTSTAATCLVYPFELYSKCKPVLNSTLYMHPSNDCCRLRKTSLPGGLMSVKPIPEGYHTLTPFMTVRDAERAIDFYKRAFGAEERGVMKGPDGKVMHAELKIGDSIIMLADEFPDFGVVSPESQGGGTSMGLHIYIEDVDAAFDRAVKAGAKVEMPVMEQFWGDRYGKLKDPFGHRWSIATHTRDLSREEMKRGMDEA